ncbi:ABC transporter substrate-binding protein [Nocardioides sp. J9]|uniref:ABC transporter substrate-binding protein n=1 Tax=Nocardioides sp. J9 TaxID=935844 RepID=UPI0021BD03CB|nr:ABC transporter substrate-binding protein [Nocardioides sp. J9]
MIAVPALALAACTSAGSTGAGGDEGDLVDGKTFTMAIGLDPGALDPGMTVLSAGRFLGQFIYGRLVALDEDGDAVPALAEKWEVDAGSAVFTLRDGIACEDGTALTATVVADNINFVADPANQSPLLGMNVQPGTVATGDNATGTVTVASGVPDAFLLHNLGALPIACGNGLADRDLLVEGKAGTGMFELVEAVANDHYTLERRKDYTWGPGDWDPDQKGLPDEVVIRIIPNETTAANLLIAGDVTATLVAGTEQDRLLERDFFHADLRAPAGQLHFNQSAGRPTADEEVRRALVQAQDLAQLRKVLVGDRGTVPTSLVTVAPDPCDVDTVDGNVPEHDVAAAEEALDAAGWTKGADGVRARKGKRLELKMIYLTTFGETMAATAELAQQEWKKIGVEVEIRGVDLAGLNEALFGTGDWDISAGQVGAALPSQLVPFFGGPTPPGGTNFAHVDNADYKALSTAAAGKVGTDGCEDWAAAEEALLEAVDVVPYADSAYMTFARGARFGLGDVGLDPTSIRMYE